MTNMTDQQNRKWFQKTDQGLVHILWTIFNSWKIEIQSLSKSSTTGYDILIGIACELF